MFTLVAIQSAIMDGTSQMQQLFAGNKVFSNMIVHGEVKPDILQVLLRALGFPGAVNFTIRSQFGSAFSFFKMRFDMTKHHSSFMFFETQ